MSHFNLSEIHSMGMLALSTALDKLIESEDSEGMAFRDVILEQFELNLYRCLIHTCPEPVIAVEFDGDTNHQLGKHLLLD